MRGFVRAAVFAALCWMIAGCSGTSEYALVTTPRVSGVGGTVQVEDIEGGNHLVTLSVRDLPPPNRFGSDYGTYVVWFIATGEAPTNAGPLTFDAISRQGNLMATTTHDAFRIKITAERDAGVSAPGRVVIADSTITL